MKQSLIFLLVLGAIAPSTFFGQGKNRISLQYGLFHSFFDGTKIIDKGEPYINKNLSTIFGGVLKDSKGIQYQRIINQKYSISVEYTKFAAGYYYKETYNNSSVSPIMIAKNSKNINLTFSRRYDFKPKLSFQVGGGINYIYGFEELYHYTLLNGWGEPRFFTFYKKNFGLNIRTGIEYHPKKWLTLYSNIDFIGIIYLNTKDSKGNNTNKYYKEEFGLKNTPSRTDLSLRFGIGFNF